MNETWLPIPGYEGHYEVSDLGRVRSLDRISAQGRPIAGRILSQMVGSRGYRQVNLHLNRKQTTHHVHRLVLFAFVGPGGEEVEGRHLNGSPIDNRLVNLAWGTHLQNMRDQRLHGTHRNRKKTHCPSGHPYAGDNLMVDKYGNRRCRVCRTETWRRVSARRSAERAAVA